MTDVDATPAPTRPPIHPNAFVAADKDRTADFGENEFCGCEKDTFDISSQDMHLVVPAFVFIRGEVSVRSNSTAVHSDPSDSVTIAPSGIR